MGEQHHARSQAIGHGIRAGHELEFFWIRAGGRVVALADTERAFLSERGVAYEEVATMGEVGIEPFDPSATNVETILREEIIQADTAGAQLGLFALVHGTPILDPKHDRLRGSRHPVTRSERTEFLAGEYGWPIAQFRVASHQSHVEIADPDLRVQAVTPVQHWHPVIEAQHVNSPLWRGRATGLVGYGSEVRQKVPTIYPMPPLRTWQDFRTYCLRELRRRDLPPDPTMLHFYSARPRGRFSDDEPDLPTVEVRNFDAPYTIADAALAVLQSKALVDTARFNPKALGNLGTFDPQLILLMSRQARRGGVGGVMVHPLHPDDGPVPVAAIAWELFDRTKDCAQDTMGTVNVDRTRDLMEQIVGSRDGSQAGAGSGGERLLREIRKYAELLGLDETDFGSGSSARKMPANLLRALSLHSWQEYRYGSPGLETSNSIRERIVDVVLSNALNGEVNHAPHLLLELGV